MALTDIEYGSLASSETLNKNFFYLLDKIAETASSINTSISSILSNIATINSRLGDLSEEIQASAETLGADLSKGLTKQEEYTKTLVEKSLMIPEWSKCVVVNQLSTHRVPSNGYLLINPVPSASGNIIVNGVNVALKTKGDSHLTVVPVKKDDVVTCTLAISSAYFLPVTTFIISEDK